MEIESLDLNLLRVLEALFMCRSVSKAAQALGVTQPSVSLALRRLRTHFDDELFIRQDGEMSPTLVADRLREPVLKIMAAVRTDIVTAVPFDPFQTERCFTISMSDLGELSFLPMLMTRLRETAPAITLRTVTPSLPEMRQGLADGSIDLALGFFIGLEGHNLLTQKLFDQGFVCIARKGWQDDAAELTLHDFLTADHVVVEQEGRSQQLLEERLRELGLQRRIALRSPHFMSVPLLVAQSDMIATVPLGVGRIYTQMANLSVLPLPFAAPIVPLQQLWHRRSHNDPGSLWLRRVIAELFLGRDPMAIVPAEQHERQRDDL